MNPSPPPDDRLDSWKEIASYLRKGVRTVQRWERTEGLPIRRHGQDRPTSVFAYKGELDAWWQEQSRRAVPEVAPPEPARPEPAAPGAPHSPARVPWRVIGVAALIGVAAFVILSNARGPTAATYRPIPLTADHGWELQPSFSPDGRQIAYLHVPPGGTGFIYVKTIGADSASRITNGTQAEFNPAWSPDGRSIAFCRRLSPGNAALILIPASGGQETRLAELAFPGGLSWSEDGRWLISREGPVGKRSLIAISVASGAKQVLAGPHEFGYRGAGLSSDLRRLIFGPTGPGPQPVYELILGPGLLPRQPPRRIIESLYSDEMLVRPEGSQIVYTDGSLEEGSSVWRLSLAPGARPVLIYRSPHHYSSPAISRDGRRLAVAVSRSYRVDIWRKSLSRPDEPSAPLISSTHSDMNVQYSPDGRRIAFHSTRAGDSDIWIADANGANPRRLTHTRARTTATPRWSPDGEWIAFESNQSGQSDVYLVRSTGGEIRRLTDSPSLDAIPNWSRNGHFIYFCSDRTGRFEIWKMPVSGGPPVQVTHDGGFTAVESPDGAWLYYSQARDYGPLWRVPIAGGRPEQIAPDVRGLFYAVTPRGVYFQSNRAISFWDMASGTTREVLTPGKPMGFGMDVSPDGESLLFTQVERESTDLYLIDGIR